MTLEETQRSRIEDRDRVINEMQKLDEGRMPSSCLPAPEYPAPSLICGYQLRTYVALAPAKRAASTATL
jgi:hypothetical protein